MTKVFVSDVLEPEGPVWLDDYGGMYLVEMALTRACVTRVDSSGRKLASFPAPGRPNGLTIDGAGRLWVADRRKGVFCFDASGRILRHITGSPDRRILWPNDLRFGPNGHLYVTDSGIDEADFIVGSGVREDYLTAPFDGRVIEIDPVAGTVVGTIDAGLKFANGLAFGADDRLYVNETITGNIYRYDLFGSGARAREFFANVISPQAPAGHKGPDGMAFGVDGRLYCTVHTQGDVTILTQEGRVADRIVTGGAFPTNIAFQGGRRSAVVTEVTNSQVEVIDLPTTGLPLHLPAFEL